MTGSARAPSGKQVELAAGAHAAVFVEVSGGLRTYTYGDRELVDGYALDRMSTAGRGQLLVPWPNRIADGSYEFDGDRHQLPLDEAEKRNALHGLARWAAWTLREHEPQRAVLSHEIHPRPGYPFSLSVEVEYALSDDGLSARITATNVGARPCPYGCGAHPFLRLAAPSIDPLLLHVPAGAVLIPDERGIPIRSQSVDGTEFDFRRPRAIGRTTLDHAVTELERDAHGRVQVTLTDPDSGEGVTLWVDDAFAYLMLFTGDPAPDVARRSLAVEPMTCPPNAFQTGEALVRLEPGESHTGGWGIAPFDGKA